MINGYVDFSLNERKFAALGFFVISAPSGNPTTDASSVIESVIEHIIATEIGSKQFGNERRKNWSVQKLILPWVTSSIDTITAPQIDFASQLEYGNVVRQPFWVEVRMLDESRDNYFLMLVVLNIRIEITGIIFNDSDLQAPAKQMINLINSSNSHYAIGHQIAGLNNVLTR